MGEALDELGAFLHDGEIRREVRVEYGLEAETPKRGVDLARGELSRLHTESFAQGDAHGGRNLYGGETLLVAQGVPCQSRLVAFVNRAHGAVRRALPALNARRIVERDVGCGSNLHLLATPDKLQRPDVLHFLADDCAPPALDALVRVKHDRGRALISRNVLNSRTLERHLADTKLRRHALQLANPRARAPQAVIGVRAEDKLHHGLTDLHDVGVVRRDLHAFGNFGTTGSKQLWRGAVPHHADSARRPSLHVGVMAERGNPHRDLLRCLKDRCPARNFNGDTVDLKMHNIFHGFSSP